MKAKKSVPKVPHSTMKQWLTLLRASAETPAVGSSRQTRHRVVVDTNVLISGLLFGGKPAQVLRHVVTSQHLVLNDVIVDECDAFLHNTRPKISRKYRHHLHMVLEKYCHSYEAVEVGMIRDINDVDIVRLALTHYALIVTNDHDLLEYKTDTDVFIISVNDYCELFAIG